MYRSKDSDVGNSKSSAAIDTSSDAALSAPQDDAAAVSQAIRLAQATVDLTNVKQTFTSTEGARIQLPAGTTFDQIVVKDGNLYLIQPDGTVIVILNAIQFPPTLVVGDITIPSDSLAQVLSQAPEGVPTAGPAPAGTESSGLNGEGPIGETGPLTPIGPLLPPTGLVFNLFPVEDFDAFEQEDEGVDLGTPPPVIGTPDVGAVEEDDLGGNIISLAQFDGPYALLSGSTCCNADGNDLDGSRPEALFFMGNLDVTGATTITFDPAVQGAKLQNGNGTDLTANGKIVYLHLINPTTLVGFTDKSGGSEGIYDSGLDHEVFIVTLDAAGTGSYTIEVLCNLDHLIPVHNGQDGDTDGNDGDGYPTPADEELLQLNFPFIATNGGGSTPGIFSVLWQDDMPIIGESEYPEYYENSEYDEEWEESGTLIDEDEDLPNSLQGGPGDDDGGLYVEGDLNILWGSDAGNSNDPEATYGDRMIVMTSLVVTDQSFFDQDGNPATPNTLLDIGFTMTSPSTYDVTVNTNNLKALVALDPGNPDELSQVDIKIEITTDANLQNVIQGIAVDTNGDPILDGSDPIVVFEVTTDDSGSGSFTYELFHPLVHPLQDNPFTFPDQVETSYEDNLFFTFGFNAKDSDLDTVSGQFEVEVDDDSPRFEYSGGLFVTDSITHDESEGLQTVVDGFAPTSTEDDNDNDTAGSEFINLISGPTVASLFDGVTNTGLDNDVTNDTSGVNPAIGYARSGFGTPFVGFSGVEFGADGPFGGTTDPGSGAITYELTLGAAAGPVPTGLQTTEGQPIFLFLENGLVVGRYDGDDGDSEVTNDGDDPAAFAIAVNPDTGELFLVQYVSLLHGSPGDGTGGTHDEAVSLGYYGNEIPVDLFLQVTFKDGDEDAISDSVRIGNAVYFEDDGPRVLFGENEQLVMVMDTVDEADLGNGPTVSPGVNSTPVTTGGTLIDFEGFTDLENASTLFAAQGVTFEAVNTPASPPRIRHDPRGDHDPLSGIAVLENPDPGNQSTDMNMLFSIPRSAVEFYFSDNAPINDYVFTAFGAGDVVLDTLTVTPTDLSNNQFKLFISFVRNSAEIVKISVDSQTTLEFQTDYYGIDDLRLDGQLIGGGGSASVTLSLTGLVDFGADGPGDTPFVLKTFDVQNFGALTSTGLQVKIVSDGSTLTGFIEDGAGGDNGTLDGDDTVVFTVEINGTDLIFTLLNELDHPIATDPLELEFGQFINAYDGDDDFVMLTGQVKVKVNDDTPAIGEPESAAVDEDDLPVIGNNDNEAGDDDPVTNATIDTDSDPTTVAGSLDIDWGEDDTNNDGNAIDRMVFFTNLASAVANISVVDSDGQSIDPATLTSLGETILYTLNGDGDVLTAFVDSGATNPNNGDLDADDRVVFTVTLSDTGNGSYVFDLEGPLDHPYTDSDFNNDGDPETAYEDNLIFTFGFTAKDADGDTDDGTFSVDVDDDLPLADLSPVENGMLVLDESLGTDGSIKDEPGNAANNDEDGVADPFAVAGGSNSGGQTIVLIGYNTAALGTLFTNTTAFGADGEKPSSGSLFELTDGSGDPVSGVDSGLDDTATGNSVFLFSETVNSLEVIVGREGTDATDAQTGDIVFILSIDPATGALTAAQYRAVVHDDNVNVNNDHDEGDDQLELGTDPEGTPVQQNIDDDILYVKLTATDNDDDSDTALFELGSLIKFEDDGPAITDFVLGDAPDMIIVDETPDDGDEPSPNPDGVLAQVTVELSDFVAGAFNIDFGTDGPFDADHDGTADAMAEVYSLEIDPGTGTNDTGLVDTLSGSGIILIPDTVVTGDVLGVTDDANEDVVFRISVDAGTGAITVTLYRAIFHDDIGDFDEANDNGTDANDADPDEIGFEPIQQAITDGLLYLKLTVKDGDEDVADARFDLGPNIKFEDDGPALLSGMVMGTVEEEHLDLDLAGTPYPTLSQGNEDTEDDAGGLDNDEDAPGFFDNVTQTFTGNAGNGQSLASLVDLGSDGGIFTLKDVLDIDDPDDLIVRDTNGDPVTSKGETVSFREFDDSVAGQKTLVAQAGGEDDGNGGFTPVRTIFTLTVLENGDWTVTYYDQVDHALPPEGVLAEENLLTLALGAFVLAVDGDGDFIMLDAASLLVKVIDDIPVDFTPETASVANAGVPGDSDAQTFDLNFAAAVGADEDGRVTFNIDDSGGPVPVTDTNGNAVLFNGQELFWSQDNSGPMPVLTAETAGNVVAFTVTIDGDQYIVDLEGEIRNGAEFTFDVEGSGISGGNKPGFALTQEDIGTPQNPTGITSDGIIITGTNNGNLATINSSQGNLAVNGTGQSITDGEVMRFDFVTDVGFDSSTQSGFSYGVHRQVSGFAQEVTQVQGSGTTATFTITAFNTDEDDDLILDSGDDVLVPLTAAEVKVFDGDPNDGGTSEVVSGTMGLTITDNGAGVVTIVGIQEGWYYQIVSDLTFEAIEIAYFDGPGSESNFDLGDIIIATANALEPFDIEVPVKGTDEDGDMVLSTILIETSPPPEVSISNATNTAELAGVADPLLAGVTESPDPDADDTGVFAYFQLKLSAPLGDDVTVRLEALDDDAGAGPVNGDQVGATGGAGNDFENTDFEYSVDGGLNWLPGAGPDGTDVTIPGGSTSILVRVEVFDDALTEPVEAFRVAIDSVVTANASIATGNAPDGGFGGTGEAQIISDEAEANVAPTISASGVITYLAGGTGGVNKVGIVNRITFQDINANANGVIVVTLALLSASSDTLTAANLAGSGITVVSGDGTDTLVLQGTIADMNDYLGYGQNVIWDPNGNSLANRTLRVTVEDDGGLTDVLDVGLAASTFDFDQTNVNVSAPLDGYNMSNGADVDLGNFNDFVRTSWVHIDNPSADAPTIYDGSAGTVDGISLTFTPEQLEEILSDGSVGGFRERLDDFQTTPGGDLDLSDSSWNAIAQNFEVAGGFSIAVPRGAAIQTSFGNGGLPAASMTPTAGNDLLIGDAGDNTFNGGGGDDIILGLQGDDDLDGGAGSDLILGGDGNDTIDGGAGDSAIDVLSGGDGADTFVLSDNSGIVDFIVDYDMAEGDVFDLTAILDVALNQAAVDAAVDYNPANGLINVSGTNVAQVLNVPDTIKIVVDDGGGNTDSFIV